MNRRDFVTSTAVLGAGLLAPARLLAKAQPAALARAGRLFEVTTTIALPPADEDTRLWLPLFDDRNAYQQPGGQALETSGRARIVRDQGARMLEVLWPRGSGARTAKVTEQLTTGLAAPAPTRLSPAERRRYTASSAAMPLDGIVREQAARIIGDLSDRRAQVQAIYQWVIANTWRDPATPGCGTGDAAAMLSTGKLGGKCADINSLMVALSRAVGIPARDTYGIRLAASARFKSLGRSGTISGAQHCRAEVWLDGTGWFPVDPADVRKAVLEEKLPEDSQPIADLSAFLFGNREANWGAYNSATGIELPHAEGRQPYHYLMYPTVMTQSTALRCIDAAASGYEIKCSEVSAQQAA